MGIPYLPPSKLRPLKTSPHPDCVWIPLRCCMIPESNVAQIKPRRLSDREAAAYLGPVTPRTLQDRSEEHTSELQSLMRISYAVFCLKTQNTLLQEQTHNTSHQPNNTP